VIDATALIVTDVRLDPAAARLTLTAMVVWKAAMKCEALFEQDGWDLGLMRRE
jgi:hypothetical protein